MTKSVVAATKTPGLVLGLALLGTTLTGYLTVTHYLQAQPLFCTGQGTGCDLVLNSEYATLGGLPLTALGFLTYGALALLAGWVALASPTVQTERWPKIAWPVFLVSGAGTLFSGYLLFLLATVLRSPTGDLVFCPYCLTSAATMTGIWVLNLAGHSWEDGGKLWSNGVVLVAVMAVALTVIRGEQEQAIAVNHSFAGQLAQHLQTTNVKMYGAFWCPHCREQKAAFGEAAALVPYVECDPRGEKAQAALCQTKNIRSYPTWEIDGQLVEGARSLTDLAKLTGYQG
ncbi:MAG TPA: Vitamin K epoxide reductase [Cyanobacteria bacterium UBA8156]|nr:Vitamin K epoxide reductase [Cyanobacteria bacterium UBA8156]